MKTRTAGLTVELLVVLVLLGDDGADAWLNNWVLVLGTAVLQNL